MCFKASEMVHSIISGRQLKKNFQKKATVAKKIIEYDYLRQVFSKILF